MCLKQLRALTFDEEGCTWFRKEQIACPAHDEEDRDEELEDTPDEEAGELAIEGRDADGGLRRSLRTHSKTRLGQRGAETLSTRICPKGLGGDESACAEGVPPDRCSTSRPRSSAVIPTSRRGHIESRQELGRKGEEAAVRYLKSRGYAIVKRNWFCRFGEADIIARDRKARCASSK